MKIEELKLAMTMKVRELRKLPHRDWAEAGQYDSLYIINSGKRHESGYSLIYIVGRNDDKMEIAAACDDIVWDLKGSNQWDIRTDMVYPSGIIHFWSNKFDFMVGPSLSSTDIYLRKKKG